MAIATLIVRANVSSFLFAPVSMTTGPLDIGPANGPLATVISSDALSAIPVNAAVSLWNSYHPFYKGPLIRVKATAVSSYPGLPDVIGQASCNTADLCSPPGGQWCCGTVALTVLASRGVGMFDVFVHEIGHAVIDLSATDRQNPARSISTMHWVPEEHREIMGATLEFPAFMSVYTARAPDQTTTVACTESDCPGECRPPGAGASGLPPKCTAWEYHPPASTHPPDDGLVWYIIAIILLWVILFGIGCYITRRRDYSALNNYEI